MLNPAVLFTAISIAFHNSEVYCDPIQDIDFKSILQLAQQQNVLDASDNKYKTDSREEYDSHYGSLKSQEIVELVHKAIQDKDIHNNKFDNFDLVERLKEPSIKHKIRDNTHKGRYSYVLYDDLMENKLNDGMSYSYESNDRNKYKNAHERYKDSRYNQEALEQLLSDNVSDKQYQSQSRYRLKPNPLLGSSEVSYNRAQDSSFNLGSYSKVYVILNSKAIEKSSNKDKLNDLLSKILALTSSSNYGLDREKKRVENHYKGFSVLPGLLSRRARRDSRETYGVKDSIEEDFKPKRSRNDRGIGGGGRTAIPYIRHRGDIYERDN